MIKYLDELNDILEELAKQEEAKGFNLGIKNAANAIFRFAETAFVNEEDAKAKTLRDLGKQIKLLQKDYDIGAWEKIETWLANNK
jgi:hypothetical protein